jgi:cytochrome c oxidase subunit 2
MNARKYVYIFIIPFVLAFFSSLNKVSADSNLSDDYDGLFLLVTVISIIVALGVIIMWAYFIFKFREGTEVERKPLSHTTSRKLEMTWTLVAIGIIIVLMIVSYPVLFELDDSTDLTGPNGEVAEDIFVEAVPFSWFFTAGGTWDGENYIGGGNRTNFNVDLQVDTAYRFVFNSTTRLIHSFYVHELNMKMDVLPGIYNTFSIIIEDPGVYQILCAEYCGGGHSFMRGSITVV